MERNAAQSNAARRNNSELVVCAMFNGCQALLQTTKYSPVLPWVCCGPQGTSAHSLGITGLNIVDPEWGIEPYTKGADSQLISNFLTRAFGFQIFQLGSFGFFVVNVICWNWWMKEALWLSFVCNQRETGISSPPPPSSGMVSYELPIVLKTLTGALENVIFGDQGNDIVCGEHIYMVSVAPARPHCSRRPSIV